MGLDEERRREFYAYLAQEGVGVVDFARGCALADRYGPITDDCPRNIGIRARRPCRNSR